MIRCHKCGGSVLLDTGEYKCLWCGRSLPVINDRRYYVPMLAKLCETPFESEAYLYEPKIDGIRGIAYLSNYGKSVILINRAGNDVTDKFPELQFATTVESCVLDGEIACLDENDRPDFQRVQTRMNRKHGIEILADYNPATYFAFDILEHSGKPMLHVPLCDRKNCLQDTIVPCETVYVNEFIAKDAIKYLNALTAKGFEGLMAKTIRGTYREGKRTNEWLKFKARKTDIVFVGGISYGYGKREPYFGALICGRYHEGQLYFCGEVGTGFTDWDLKVLTPVFKAASVKDSPFVNNIGSALVMQWVRPIPVEVTYLELTSNGTMRHASYERLV